MVVFKLPALKYEYNALEPYVDTLTMSIHHSLEHEVYVQYTNEYVEKVSDLAGVVGWEMQRAGRSDKMARSLTRSGLSTSIDDVGLCEQYQGGELKGKSLVEVVQHAKATPIRNNAGGHYNHRCGAFHTLS